MDECKFVYVNPSTGERTPVDFGKLNGVLYDSDGNKISSACKCGKQADKTIVSKSAFMHRCSECL